MMELVYILAGIGLLFNFLGALGLLRFPDVYTRLHAETKCTTFGSMFIVFSIIAYSLMIPVIANQVVIWHSLVALIALLITNPTGAHAIARAAYKSGVKPIAVVDDYRRYKE